MDKYKKDLATYKANIKSKQKVEPIKISTITKTISIPKYEMKRTYYIDWSNLEMKTKYTRVPVMKNVTVTTNRLKKGFGFDETKGEFYTEVKC